MGGGVLAPFFWLTFKAFFKRVNFWVLVSVCAVFIILAYFYDLFGLGEPSTLFAETYAAVALLYALLAPLFCVGDILEWEVRQEATALLWIRPAGVLSTVVGRTLGIVVGTNLGLVVLVAVFHITASVGKSYVPPATYLVFPVCLAASLSSSSLVYMLAGRIGFVATAAALFALLTASNIIPVLSRSPFAYAFSLFLPNFHIVNLQSLIASTAIPSLKMVLLCFLHHLLYAAFLTTVSVLLCRLHKPAEQR